ncbi:hypothetical protein ACR79K_25260 [Sphingobacterium siyangense]|uniref:hypothetical protein n=1 Tax=Sphingobacterium siyangense TaxID=459529 RepID=UPI003DA5FEEC
MDKRYTSFAMAYLKENYSNVFQEIERAYIPQLSEIERISTRFCEYNGVSINDIRSNRNGKMLNLKYKLIGILLWLYQPGKITSKERLDTAIASELKQLLELNTPNLNTAVKCAVNLFYYAEFKVDVVQFCNYFKLVKS